MSNPLEEEIKSVYEELKEARNSLYEAEKRVTRAYTEMKVATSRTKCKLTPFQRVNGSAETGLLMIILKRSPTPVS